MEETKNTAETAQLGIGDVSHSTEFGIHFGAMAEPISKQLKKQGFKYDEEQVKHFEKQLDAITRLRFADLIADTIATKAFNKLCKRIQQHVCKVNKLAIVK